jgi:hypothetical protein
MVFYNRLVSLLFVLILAAGYVVYRLGTRMAAPAVLSR